MLPLTVVELEDMIMERITDMPQQEEERQMCV
jgi:hypothetical protein